MLVSASVTPWLWQKSSAKNSAPLYNLPRLLTPLVQFLPQPHRADSAGGVGMGGGDVSYPDFAAEANTSSIF